MVQKKICMLGATAVGKTSLVARYVRNMFSEKYHSSIGVKVDKKVLSAGGQEMTLLLWDIYGDDEFQRIRTSYLRGASGYLLVVDGTRRSTLDRALEVKKSVEEAIGQVPFILVVNKADLVDDWDMPEDLEDRYGKEGWEVIRSSAKTGMGVEEAFSGLAVKLAAG
jgi:small GTP-binding protein